jgi:hypothetical protein
MTLNGNEKTLEKQAKVCVMMNANANDVADSLGWQGAIKTAFVNKVNELRNARLHNTYQANPSL